MKVRTELSKHLNKSFENYEMYSYTAFQVLEEGITSFEAFVMEMIDSHDKEVIPFLKSLYIGLVYHPDFKSISDKMDSPLSVEGIDLEELLVKKENNFRLIDEDYLAIEIAKRTMKKILNHPSVDSKGIIAIGHYLYSIERLPLITNDANTGIDITYTNGDENFRESKIFTFRITDEEFHIDISGYVYNKNVGGDSIGYPGWYVEKDGGRDSDCDLSTLEQEIDEYLELGAKVSYEDYSEIEEFE